MVSIIDPNLPPEEMKEYLRRNLLHASACGAGAGAKTAKERLLKTKRPQKWLLEQMDGIIDRAERVASEMAKHRDEIEIYITVKETK